MKFDKFTIKYLPEVFPNVDFTQTFSENFHVIATENRADIAKTADRWFSTIDTDAINRNVQASLNTVYTAEFIVGENVDFSILESAGNVTAQTDNGLYMTLFDVEVTKELQERTRAYKVTLVFTVKGVANIASFLDTENVEKLQSSGQSVNSVTYEVSQPAYTTRITTNTLGFFTIANIGEFANIEINDFMYLHSNEFDPNNSFVDMEVVKCVNKTTNLLSFEPREPKNRSVIVNKHIQLDYTPSVITDPLVVPRKLQVQLFTMLHPKVSLSEPIFSDEILTNGGVKQYTNAITANLLNCLFYVKETDLWKVKYMNYADLCYFQTSVKTYYADYTADIIVLNERKSLLGLFEAELNLPYETISGNITK